MYSTDTYKQENGTLPRGPGEPTGSFNQNFMHALVDPATLKPEPDKENFVVADVVPCNLCTMLLNGPHQYQDHLKGWRHRKNMNKRREQGCADRRWVDKAQEDVINSHQQQ